MTAPRDHDGPDARLDRQLSGLLSDAVSDVEPTDALDTIRTRTKVTPMSSRRPWLLAAGGAVVATAAVITAIALAGGNLPGTTADDDGPEPADRTSRASDPTPSESTEPSPTEPTSSAPSGGSGSDPVPVYLVSETPQGLRLFREFRPGTGEDPLLESAVATVEGRTLDPDYRSLWPVGSSVASVVSDGADILTVDITGAPHDLPPGMSEADAGLALQQVIYSVQAAHGQGRVGVQLLLDGGRTDQVLGQPASEPLANGPVLETLSMMNITYPGEGATVSGSFTANGVNNGFEANVVWRILDGEEVVSEGFTTAEGWMGDRLFPWEVEVDVSGLEPGAYTFVASNDDPSGGAEGATVSGTFAANGVNNGFEASMTWQLLDGSEVVGEGFGTAEGWMGDRLFPWEVEVDVSGLEPGAYTFVASNDDPSGGAEGAGPHTDTRVIIVE